MKTTHTIINGDVLTALKTLPDNSIHMVVTSPPFWGLRQYLFDGAVVLKKNLTPEEIEYVIRELKNKGVTPRI